MIAFISFFSFITFVIVVSIRLDKFFHFPRLVPIAWNPYISWPILITGILLMLWSVLHFLMARGTPVPLDPPPELVESGPYAYTRNPMFSGLLIALLGIGLLLGSISLTCIFLPLLVILAFLFVKGIEEPEAEKRLGVAYIEYKKRVPMFWPRLRRWGR
jgi:protein-S-isoprenylcysteine O-methyltransferase Ste14